MEERTALVDPWGARARDWADVEDEGSRDLFELVLDRLELSPGAALLDVGCGSGLACSLAAKQGVRPAGLDASPGLLEIARERVPDGDFREGDMVSLPWADATFDGVSFINTLFFASSQESALSEARRVLVSGGRVAAIAWTSPEKIESMAFLGALGPLLPPMPELDLFSTPAELRNLAESVGFVDPRVDEVPWVWRYPDLDTALRGWLSVGLSAIAIHNAGEDAVRDAFTQALAPFERDGGYRLDNSVYCLVADAPARS